MLEEQMLVVAIFGISHWERSISRVSYAVDFPSYHICRDE